jgi:S-DNA-T family DNA segregation ATPase FtsK/SpoIIIE
VVTDVKKTVNALKWCLNEMDRRFEILSQAKKRDIASYNQSADERLPYIVIIIDELSDLMIAAGKEIEASIIRLTQMARAVGMHLIIATQRPSVDVITGLIKANIPARIAFSVASGVDSKTILDTMGAEKLIGQGDMLFTTAEFSMPKRIQGVYIGDLEIKRVMNYIREKTGHFEYMDEVTQTQKVGGASGAGLEDSAGGSEDELFEEAKELIVSSGKASASFLQRRLSVGYARAARLIDELEEEGIVGPANGSKPREILVSKEEHQAQKDTPVSGIPLHNREDSRPPENYFSSASEQGQDEEEEDGSDNDPEDEESGGSEFYEEDASDQEYDQEDEDDESGDQEEARPTIEDEEDDDGLYFSK